MVPILNAARPLCSTGSQEEMRVSVEMSTCDDVNEYITVMHKYCVGLKHIKMVPYQK